MSAPAPISPTPPSAQKRARAAAAPESEQKRSRAEAGVVAWPMHQSIGRDGFLISQPGTLQQWVSKQDAARPDFLSHANAGHIARYFNIDTRLQQLESEDRKQPRSKKPSTARSRIEKTLKKWSVAHRKPREANSAPRVQHGNQIVELRDF